jgi:predicted unusual protein kinase regulating ubiquinone biosynthesis (AarF/ABC1/UbiB family)
VRFTILCPKQISLDACYKHYDGYTGTNQKRSKRGFVQYAGHFVQYIEWRYTYWIASGAKGERAMSQFVDKAMKRAFEDIKATFSTVGELENPATMLARLSDLTYSNSLLWVEAVLKAQEQYSRSIPGSLVLSRMLVMATVAADIAGGYLALRERARWFPTLVQEKDWELQHQRSAKRIMDASSSLGGALIKACQFASTRPDLLPSTYIHELSHLQDRMPPHPWSAMETMITQEIGRSSQNVFATIEKEPVAAASIAQVHRARLHDGREVAVKIQYPEIADLVDVDLRLLDYAFTAIGRVTPSIQLMPVLDYLKETLPLELDFAHEASAMTELRAALQHRTDVLVPQVVTELSTKRLLVMEFIEGIKITEREALVKAGIDPVEVARRLNDLYADQMLHLGILHADPHPGNLLVQPGPRLVLLDHGLTVQLSPSLMHALGEMVQGLTTGDFDKLRKALAEAGLPLDEQVGIMTLLQLVGILLGGESEQATSVTEIGSQVSKSLGSMPIDLILVGRALALLDGITKQLAPDLDTLEVVAHYV